MRFCGTNLINGFGILCFDLIIADKIMATLGEGTFGRVVKVKDMQM